MKHYAITSSLISKVLAFSFTAFMFIAPLTTLAQTNAAFNDIAATVGSVGNIFQYSIGIVTTLIFLFFFWNLALFIYKEGDEKAEARTKMLWGVVGIAVFSTLWGAVAFLRSVTGVKNEPGDSPQNINLPRAEFVQ